jgi:hypothetical protein
MCSDLANKHHGDWRIGEIALADGPAMRSLFRSVFGTPMSAQHWQWKYVHGKGKGLGVWDKQDQLVAHYGGMPRTLLDNGTPCLGIQGVDAAVLPQERGRLTRRGPYYIAATSFHSKFIGIDRPYLYGFGFPNLRHYRLANLLGIYEEVDRIEEFSFPPIDGAHWSDICPREMRNMSIDSSTSEALSRAWKSMQNDLKPLLIGVRDKEYLIHRYVNHPFFNYQLLGLRRWPLGRPYAFAVVRLTESNELEWLDMVCAMADLPRLANAVRRYASRCRATRVWGWITASQRHYFVNAGAQLNETEIIIPGNFWEKAAPIKTQSRRWWLMSGDTDFH